MSGKFCELVLTCAGQKEAEKIADALLKKRLIACAKFMPIQSKYHWQGKIVSGSEVLMLIESRANLFSRVEAEIKKLHSYDTFVLKALPINAINKPAADWLEAETNG